jgi:hypothetical protein
VSSPDVPSQGALWEDGMKVRLRIEKDGTSLSEGVYDVFDAESFGRAFAHLWTQMLEIRLAKASSIGALYDALDERLLDELYEADIRLSKA